jgi:hypothetical protein
MSQFDHLQALNDDANFRHYGDPAHFEPGPLLSDRGSADTEFAILDHEDVRDDLGVVVQTLTLIEYPKLAWPHPRRADRITLNHRVWVIDRLHRDTGTDLIVEVTEWHGE